MTSLLSTTLTNSIAVLSDRFSTRKVTVEDVRSASDSAYAMANEYVTSYAGTFGFMTSMHAQLVGRNQGLNDSQCAAVLNCAIADHRYNERKAASTTAQQIVTTTASAPLAPITQVVEDGWYTIVGPQGGHRTLRLQTVEDDKSQNAGVKQWLAYLSGSDNEGDYTSIGFVYGATVTLFKKNTGKYQDIVAAAKFLLKNADKIGEYGKQYAIRSGKCYVCNRKLTTPESVAAGIGPICASKRGL